jgi:hypothetical protein
MAKEGALYAEKLFDKVCPINSAGYFPFILSDIRLGKRFLVAGTEHKSKEHRCV